MVPRWPCPHENAGPASLFPRLAWGGIPKENTYDKKHEDCNPNKECGKNTDAEGELQELKSKALPTPRHRPLPDSKTEIPVLTVINLTVF